MDTKDNVNSIRYRLLELRGDESQQDLADEIGVSRSLVKAWESGDRKIKIDDLISLSKHFHVSADYLLGLTDARTDDRDVKFISDYTGLSASTIEKFHKYAHLRSHESGILEIFDRFITLYYEKLLHRLYLLSGAVDSAKHYLSLEHPKFDGERSDFYYQLLSQRLYSFSELCRDIPAGILGSNEVCEELERRRQLGDVFAASNEDLSEFLEHGLD